MKIDSTAEKIEYEQKTRSQSERIESKETISPLKKIFNAIIKPFQKIANFFTGKEQKAPEVKEQVKPKLQQKVQELNKMNEEIAQKIKIAQKNRLTYSRAFGRTHEFIFGSPLR